MPSAAIFADYSASTLTLEAQYPELLRTRGDDATWGRWFFLADGTKAWYPANGKIGGANLFQSANYNTGKLWSNHCGNSLSVLTDKEPDNSSLYRGYHYSYSAGVLNAKNAQEIGFGSTTATSTTQLTSAMSYVPALTAGTGLPTPINAAKIGSQQNTGSASRDYANGIRCMKE